MTLGGRQRIFLMEKIPSRMDAAEAMCLRVRETLLGNGLYPVCFTVELLARECLANAVNHGNRGDSEKSVELRLSVGPKWIRLEVSDEGPGFDWRSQIAKEGDATACSGRGVQLYALYAHRVRFNRSGNRVTLWIDKNLTELGEEKMAAYVIEEKNEHGSIKLTGDLTAILVPELQKGLKETLGKGTRDLVFDLENTAMLDSSGIGLLIAAANSVAPMGGKVSVTNASPNIFRLLQSMRLTGRLNVSAKAA